VLKENPMIDVYRLLNSIGKATFIKYYYNFKDKSRDYCIHAFEENFTNKAKSSKAGHAQMIFNRGWEKDALEIIVSSKRLDDFVIIKAKEILNSEV
jgi:hypothetical protein